MEKVKKLLFMFLFIIPFFVGIVSVKADECGKYTLSDHGNNTDVGGNIKQKVDKKKSTDSTLIYKIDVRTRKTSTVHTIDYLITNNDGTTCSKSLSSSDFGTYGNVIFELEVDRNNTKSITINASDIKKTKIDDITPEIIDVQTDAANVKSSNSSSSSGGNTSSMGNLKPTKNLTCDDSIREIVKELWGYLILLTPILVMVMGTIDFVKALGKNDSDAIKKSSVSFIKRVIALCILMYLPLLIRIIFTWFGIQDSLCF